MPEKDYVRFEDDEYSDTPEQVGSAWVMVARHPFFHSCYNTKGSLIEAMLAKLDNVTRGSERLRCDFDCEFCSGYYGGLGEHTC